MLERVNILGVGVNAINLEQTLKTIDGWIEHRERHYVCVTPAHSIMECQDDSELRTIFNNSGMTTPDGMSIVWLLKLKGYHHVKRVYGPDLMVALVEHSVRKGYRHFFYGGTDEVTKDLIEHFQTHFPSLKVAGTYSPPFRALTIEEDLEVVDLIKSSRADIVWVGISSPKQERWMADHVDRLGAPVIIGVGAAFDFLSGHKKQAPRWVQRSGLEWLYRLLHEPRRLWPRYRKYPLFVLLVLAQQLGLKRFPLE